MYRLDSVPFDPNTGGSSIGRQSLGQQYETGTITYSPSKVAQGVFVASGVAASVAIVKIGLAVAAGAAFSLTPVGWFTIGLLAVGVAILAARWAYLKIQGRETQFTEELGGGLKSFAIGTLGGLAFLGFIGAGAASWATDTDFVTPYVGWVLSLIEIKQDRDRKKW